MKPPTCRECKSTDHVELQWVCEQCGGRDTAMEVEDELTRLREEIKNLRMSCDILKSKADTAEARVAELERDKARVIATLEVFADCDNWFDTSDEAGGPYPAWRGRCEPEDIASAAIDAAKDGE